MKEKNTSNKDISIQIQEGLSKDANNYNNELYKLVKPHVGKDILEVGCSIGNITKLLIKKNNRIAGIDVVKDSIRIIKKNFVKRKNFEAHVMDASNSKILSMFNHKFDTIICMNVLEHIKGDNKTLRNFHKLLDKRGLVILICPAFQFLYGSVDASDKHYRRYTARGLKVMVEKAGFRIIDLHYINFPGMFGWYINGKILKKKMVDSNSLKLYDKVIPIFFGIENIIHPPMGLSVFCVAEKI